MVELSILDRGAFMTRATYKAEWYQRNKDRLNENNKSYLRNRRKRAISNKRDQAYFLRLNLKTKARRLGLPFDLRTDDLIVPDYCPVLGIKLVRGVGGRQDNAATVDRLNPKKGYVRDNIIIVSNLVNDVRSTATADQILRIGKFYKKMGL